MDAIQKLLQMEEYAADEVEETPAAPEGEVADCPLIRQEAGIERRLPGEKGVGLPIHMAALPNGKRTPILKTMLTSACERNCNYCGCRAGRDFERVAIKPDEMAQSVSMLTEKGYVTGAFISSGVAGGGVRTQDRLLATAEILREKMHYRGYLHLKLMPGSEKAQVERAMQLADRVSVNLEGPNSQRLSALAPQKIFLEELLQPLRWVEEIRRSQPEQKGWKGRWPSITTQFVVGAVGENDLELLQTTAMLTHDLHLARGYFSGFRPIEGTPFENQMRVNPWRVHRLYQASFLLRDYGFDFEELPFQAAGNLPLEKDPKQAWAMENLNGQPVEVNLADRGMLLRIPGIGPRGAQAILSARRINKIRSLQQLKSLGISVGRALPYILLDGHRPPQQLSLGV